MPKSKETISDSDSASGSEEEIIKLKSKPQKEKKEKEKKKESSDSGDSESEAETKSKKRSKKNNDKGSSKKAKTDSDETSWDLGGNKFVTVRPFKGKWYVDIREMYMDRDTGAMKPGKKGIFMHLDQWKQLTKVTDEVNECIKSKC